MTNNLYIFVLFFIGSVIFADEPIALLTKLRGKAKYNISSEDKFRSNAQVNTPIFHGNGIKTKARSFAQIVYLDDRSTVSAYPNTTITINGKIENRMISKQVDVNAGIVRVKVSNQLGSEFKLTTPHSELTCHKCDFWVISDQEVGDRFYKISGNGFVINPSMIDTMELINDSTIISLKDTEMEISQTSVNDNKYLELLMFDADEMSKISEEELVMRSNKVFEPHEAASNIVEIRLKNALNMERKIILTFTK